MKKFTEILKEVNKTQQKIKENNKKIDELVSTYSNIIDFKEKIAQKRSVENEMCKLNEEIKDLQITIKILNSNAKIALFNDVLPVVLEVLAKYKNKPYGPKTEQKIKDEIKEKTNCYFYILCDRFSQSYNIHPIDYNCNVYNVKCGTKYENGTQKKLLIDNKIQVVKFEELILHSSKEYIDNIPKRIKDLKRLYKKAYEKQQELEKICVEYNSLTIGSIKNIYKDKNIYPNMDI